jgi:histidinol-phosphate aminotransferase
MARAVSLERPRPRTAVERMAPYVPPTGSRQGKMRLDFNENTVGCSPRVIERLRDVADQERLAVYPEYSGARRTMAEFLGVEAGQLLFTNGTDEAIHCLINTYVDPGDEVLIPWPAYSMFRFYVELAGAGPRAVPYRTPDLAFPLEELLAAVGEQTKAILVASPNNPTGGAATLEQIEALLEGAGGAAVLIDEAYFEFHGVTAAVLLDSYPNLFVSRTFSKVYGMAGLRVGCLLSQTENIQIVAKGQSPYSVNALGVACALAAIEDQDYIQDYVQQALEGRRMLCEGLERLGVPHYRSQANFVLVRFGERTKEVCAGLRERGILIRDRSHEFEGTARITAGTPEQMRECLNALESILKAG